MVMTYAKGVFYERDLLNYLKTRGFSTTRVAGSGHGSPADILAMKNGIIVAVECKAHRNKPRIKPEKIQEMSSWCKQAGALGFLAWRAPKQDWLFLPMKNLEAGLYEDEHWLSMETFLNTLV